MAFNNFPYADLNITNLDFLFDQQGALKDWVIQQMKDFANQYIDKAYIDVNYNADTETLTLYTIPQEGASKLWLILRLSILTAPITIL